MRMRCTTVLLLIAMLAHSGCKSPLPAYPIMDGPSVLQVLNDRAASIHTVSATAQITLRDASGESITLDGALAAKNPGWLRLRAWKFSTVAFDLTLTPDGLWTLTADDAPKAARQAPASFTAAQLGRAWSLFSGEFFARRPMEVPDKQLKSPMVFAEGDLSSEVLIFCDVDRKTVTPQRFEIKPRIGGAGHSLNLERYRMVNGIVWPHRITMSSEHGHIVIDMGDVSINEDLASGAFTPPRRAVKQP